MKCLALIAVCLVATVVGDALHCCSVGDRKHIVEEWNELFYNLDGSYKVVLGVEVIKALREHSNVSVPLWEKLDGEHDAELHSMAASMMNGLDGAINLLFDVPTAVEYLKDVNQRYKDKHVPKAVIENLGPALHDIIPEATAHFTDYAWINCFNIIGEIITEGLH